MSKKIIEKFDNETLECIKFHGHFCPGIAIGIQASRLAMKLLKAQRPGDEELVCVAENDACGIDAVQFITGCTIGKGNLVLLDYGKQAFSFYNRKQKTGVRLIFKKDRPAADDGMDQILQKIRRDEATKKEKGIWKNAKEKRGMKILETSPEDLFIIRKIPYRPPAKAVVMHSIKCSSCGENVMASKTFNSDLGIVCEPCFFDNYKDTTGHIDPEYINYKPIGIIKRDIKDSSHEMLKKNIARISLYPEYRDSLFRLKEVQNLQVIFHMHKAMKKLGLVTRRYDNEVAGVLNSRSPDRPNNIGITDVKLISINGCELMVKGLDAIDGTPVLDIKPIF